MRHVEELPDWPGRLSPDDRFRRNLPWSAGFCRRGVLSSLGLRQCGSNPASAVRPPVAHAGVDTDKVPIRDADNRASRLTVVPRGPYLPYVCAVILDIASTIRSMSTMLLRVSGVSA